MFFSTNKQLSKNRHKSAVSFPMDESHITNNSVTVKPTIPHYSRQFVAQSVPGLMCRAEGTHIGLQYVERSQCLRFEPRPIRYFLSIGPNVYLVMYEFSLAVLSLVLHKGQQPIIDKKQIIFSVSAIVYHFLMKQLVLVQYTICSMRLQL